jgi:hypothetical protein
MNILILISWSAVRLAQQPVPPEQLPAERVVSTEGAWYFKGPSRASGVLDNGQAKYGDLVTVTEVKGSWWKVTRQDGVQAWLAATALETPEKFKSATGAEAEKEGQKAAAQAAAAKRGLNEDMEKEHIRTGGTTRQQAYGTLDRLMARPDYKAQRSVLESKLAEFRKSGKLGEFAAVR